MHVEVEEYGRNDRALRDSKVNVSVRGERILKKNLLFSAIEVIA